MNSLTGQIVRYRKRRYCVIYWTDTEVHLQSMDEDKLFITMPRTKFGGLNQGS
jgi:hypothetical protein